MPIYEYKCQNCGSVIEKLQKYSDDPLKHCDKCDTDGLEKVLSANTGFCLMGYGWDKPGMSVSKKR